MRSREEGLGSGRGVGLREGQRVRVVLGAAPVPGPFIVSDTVFTQSADTQLLEVTQGQTLHRHS